MQDDTIGSIIKNVLSHPLNIEEKKVRHPNNRKMTAKEITCVWVVNNKSLIVFGNFSGISKSSTISEPR